MDHTSYLSMYIEPTLRAPTAVSEKYPCSHCPDNKTLSFNASSPGMCLTAHGDTVTSSPREKWESRVKIEFMSDVVLVVI